MKKSLRGSLCAYCGVRPATTEDHVFGRGFFPAHLRDRLPKVPACNDCNNRKSDYEHYAMAVFPLGSMDKVGAEILTTRVRDRLKKDQRLRRQIASGHKRVLVANPDGLIIVKLGIPFDHQKAFSLFQMIIRGLLWYHCCAPIPPSYVVRVFSLTDSGIRLFKQHILSLSPEQFQEISLADGAFRYQFTRDPDDPFSSAWVLDVYNSLNMCGTVKDGRLLRVHVAALTGPEGVSTVWRMP